MTQPYKPPYSLSYIYYMLVELVNYRSIYYCNSMSTKQSCYMCLCRIMIRQHEYLMYMLYAYFIWCIFICYIYISYPYTKCLWLWTMCYVCLSLLLCLYRTFLYVYIYIYSSDLQPWYWQRIRGVAR